MIVEFTRLAFTTSTNLRIEAHINPSDWYKNCTIKKVTIDIDKTVRADGPSDEPIYSEDVTGIVTDAGKTLITNIDLTDILCDPAHHVALYVGDGWTVEAKGVQNGQGGDWRTGDQGGEIDCYSAYGRGWTEVYRYTGK